jgi:glycosyltransferase involved in cell wall biosynthesis
MSSLGRKLLKARVSEYLFFDSLLFRMALAVGGTVAGLLLYLYGQTRRGFELLARLHRANYFRWAGRPAQRLTRSAAHHKAGHPLLKVYEEYVERLAPTVATEKYFEVPDRIFMYFALVLKSARPGEKGVIVLEYNYILPTFARLFDVPRIAERYHLVLEPTWSGYCTLDVLTYSQYDFPVFVQAHEPRDAAFVDGLDANLVSVPTSTNWWVDHRLFRPLPGVKKDIDILMIAAWGRYKRHHRFFAGLRSLRRAGHRPHVVLLGYPINLSKDDILQEAQYYGVADQVEIQEYAPYARINEYLNRSKVNVVWSRREGVNRAIVEGMFAGVPCLVREGFNYGHKYSYINEHTGRYSTEHGLPEALLWMIENHQRFSPRDWVMANMSCQKATEILAERIRARALNDGEPWTEGLAVKTNELNGMLYWDPAERQRFEADYAYLATAVRKV